MKLLVACAVVVAVSAIAPPKISLDLTNTRVFRRGQDSVMHPDGLLQPNGDRVTSRQDWAEECRASSSTTEQSCPFPEAKAYDHNDNTINVREKIFLTYQIENGVGVESPEKEVDRSEVDFSKRGIYLFKFDATDSAGNHAEQVVFELILNDLTAPTLTLCACPDQPFAWGTAETLPLSCIFDSATGVNKINVESGSSWTFCRASAKDNCDGTSCSATNIHALSTVSYCITKCDHDAKTTCEDQALACENADTAVWLTGDDATIDTVLDTDWSQTNNGPARALIKVRATDSAGTLGSGGADNVVTGVVDVTFKDTTPPKIVPQGEFPEEFECDHTATYKDESNGVGNDAVVLSDNLASQVELKSTFTADLSNVNVGIPNDYWVTYDVTDTVGLKANGCKGTASGPQDCGAKRRVAVQDNKPPTIQPKDGLLVVNYAVGSVQDIDTIDGGVTVSDQCDELIGQREVTQKWVELPKDPKTNQTLTTWVPNKVGTFKRKYEVCDLTGLCHSFTRSFVGTDQTQPIIKVLGNKTLTIAAKMDNPPYEDEGAACHDFVDGIFSAKISEKGDEVLTRVPGTYIVRYECSDLAGIPAQEQTRTVIVKDFDCPKIKLNEPLVQTIEAGFAWTDPGWTTTDDIDGDLSPKCIGDKTKGCTTVTGDSIDEMGAFVSRRSCSEIAATSHCTNQGSCPSGWYFITTFVESSKAFSRVKVWCDMKTKSADGRHPGYTYYPCTGCDKVKPYKKCDAGKCTDSCADFGLSMAEFDEVDDGDEGFRTGSQWKGAESSLGTAYTQFFTSAGIESTNYLCSTNDHNDEQSGSSQDDVRNEMYHGSLATNIAQDQISANEQGKYLIEYKAKDLSGVDQCAVQHRTVIVRDTFKPVITLHLKNKAGELSLIQQGTVDDPKNPAVDPKKNPFLKDILPPDLMAERSSGSHGWMLAALASATAGVALLAASGRSQVEVSVPV